MENLILIIMTFIFNSPILAFIIIAGLILLNGSWRET